MKLGYRIQIDNDSPLSQLLDAGDSKTSPFIPFPSSPKNEGSLIYGLWWKDYLIRYI
jgi:hypothetical protein